MFLVLLKEIRMLRWRTKGISYRAVSHLEYCQRWSSPLKIGNGLNRFTIFEKQAPLQMFSWIPNVPPIVGVVNGERGGGGGGR